MITVPEEIIQDVRAINRIPAITNILEVVSRTTGMGFAAVARVTKRSLGGAINNKIDFGLKEGDELQIQTTICNEICQSRQAVIITRSRNRTVFNLEETVDCDGVRLPSFFQTCLEIRLHMVKRMKLYQLILKV